jgi:ATP-dependent DNA helicase PIF1
MSDTKKVASMAEEKEVPAADAADANAADDAADPAQEEGENEDGGDGAEVELSPMQTLAETRIMAGESVLLLGPGGTGKSFLLRRVVEKLRAAGKVVAITAMTGLAGYHIGGSTLHSFAGIGLGEGTVDELVRRVRYRGYARRQWQQVDVLVVDEISMLSHQLFDKLDKIGGALRRNREEPWGGLQLIGCGDFLQLPPIQRKRTPGGKSSYCFEAQSFSDVFRPANTIVFEHNFRQGGDAFLPAILTDVRRGELSARSKQLLGACVHKTVPAGLGVDPVCVFARRAQVDQMNAERMRSLPDPMRQYRHRFHANRKLRKDTATKLHQSMLRSLPCDDVLRLKVGTQVMHICNDRHIQKHNGSMGVVVGFNAAMGHLPTVKFTDGTVHTIRTNAWETPDKSASVAQIPLIQAFAVTIHKIQGSTLDYARINVGSSLFEYNQMYVALSRLRTLEGLFLMDFDASRAMAHPAALGFYQKLEKQQQQQKARRLKRGRQPADTTMAEMAGETFVIEEEEEGRNKRQRDIRSFFYKPE